MLDFELKEEDDLSSIGDSFVNLIYSIALSNLLQKPVGKRASNAVLKEALLKSNLRGKAGTRLKKQEMGDFVEVELFRAWIEGRITLEESVRILTDAMRGEEDAKKAPIRAFAELLNEVENRTGRG